MQATGHTMATTARLLIAAVAARGSSAATLAVARQAQALPLTLPLALIQPLLMALIMTATIRPMSSSSCSSLRFRVTTVGKI
jgi:hypothetical protein